MINNNHNSLPSALFAKFLFFFSPRCDMNKHYVTKSRAGTYHSHTTQLSNA